MQFSFRLIARRAITSTPLKSQSNQNFAAASEAWASAELGSNRSADEMAAFTSRNTFFEDTSPEIGNTMRASAKAECAKPYVGSCPTALRKKPTAFCASRRLYLAR